MPLGEGGGSVPDLGRESRPPGLVLPPFSKLSLEDQEIGRGELRGRRHRPSACTRCRQLVPHACRRDTFELALPVTTPWANRRLSFDLIAAIFHVLGTAMAGKRIVWSS